MLLNNETSSDVEQNLATLLFNNPGASDPVTVALSTTIQCRIAKKLI